jgi:hypothetical protein
VAIEEEAKVYVESDKERSAKSYVRSALAKDSGRRVKSEGFELVVEGKARDGVNKWVEAVLGTVK